MNKSSISAKKNILILFGGGGNEHKISILSKAFIKKNLATFKDLELIEVEIDHKGNWFYFNEEIVPVSLSTNGEFTELKSGQYKKTQIDFVIPCIHGNPGENGQLLAFLEMIKIPFLGNPFEPSVLCFNKMSTKLWMKQFGIPVVPYICLYDLKPHSLELAQDFLEKNKDIFIKASSEGSSVGVFKISYSHKKDLEKIIEKSFSFSPYVLMEKAISGRELEISTFFFNDKIHATLPGEIICEKGFYDYDEKYSEQSSTKTISQAEGISPAISKQMQEYCIKLFHLLKLKDFCRIDFFLDKNNQLYVNEINTFPGMTPISLFPQMLQASGVDFGEFLYQCINKKLN